MLERTYLFVPADRAERFDKALGSGAHAVIVDLEDAVAPEQKDVAREAFRAWLPHAGRDVYVRINPAATPWYEADLTLLRHARVRGVMLPKSEHPDVLAHVAGLLGEHQVVLPLIETVAGYFAMAQLALGPKVDRLAFGSLDFMADAGIRADGSELDPVRLQIVLASRQAGLRPPLDGVTTTWRDPGLLQGDARRARRQGFGGKLCIHPMQVPVVNAEFRPSGSEVEWARRVLGALGTGTLGAVSVDGKLVDRPVETLARAILREHDAAA